MHSIRYGLVCLLSVSLLVSGCDQQGNEKQQANVSASKKEKDGLVKHHRADGSLASEIEYRNEKKHGLAKGYYKNGNLKSEIYFEDDIQHGLAKQYYQNGKLYRETPYTHGKKDGIQKIYRENGKLLAEIPYKLDALGVGTVEYTPSGKPKKQLPKIKVEHINNLLKNNQYIVRVSLTEGYKNVKYYIGELEEGKYKGDKIMRMESKNGVLELKYNLPPGTFIMETHNIVAETTTQMRSPYLLQQSVNIAAENKGY